MGIGIGVFGLLVSALIFLGFREKKKDYARRIELNKEYLQQQEIARMSSEGTVTPHRDDVVIVR